jgi:hypothetical protein
MSAPPVFIAFAAHPRGVFFVILPFFVPFVGFVVKTLLPAFCFRRVSTCCFLRDLAVLRVLRELRGCSFCCGFRPRWGSQSLPRLFDRDSKIVSEQGGELT